MFDFGHEMLNRAFFDEVDLRLAHVNRSGVTCGLVRAWSKGAEPWQSFASDEARRRFARYVVARHSAYDVVFIVAGEWDLLGERPRDSYCAIGREIMRWDLHRRLREIHAGRRRTVQDFCTEPWMSFGDYQQMYRAPNERESTACRVGRAGLHPCRLPGRMEMR